MVQNKSVKYYKDGKAYYKINNKLKRITKLENNQVEYLDYDKHNERIISFKKIRVEDWKNVENKFFLSRHFQWEHNGVKYTTTDKPIEWKKASTCGREATVFHNGKIWIANDYYYPRINLTRIEEGFGKNLDDAKKMVEESVSLMSKEDQNKVTKEGKEGTMITLAIELMHKSQKWTDVGYCRNFEKIS